MITTYSSRQIEKKLSDTCNLCCCVYYTNDDIIKQYFEENKKDPTDTELITYCKTKMITTEPVLLSCCSKDICKLCIEQHIKYTNNIICPYCRHDHNKYDMSYITYTEPELYDKDAWKLWWNNHVDIFF